MPWLSPRRKTKDRKKSKTTTNDKDDVQGMTVSIDSTTSPRVLDEASESSSHLYEWHSNLASPHDATNSSGHTLNDDVSSTFNGALSLSWSPISGKIDVGAQVMTPYGRGKVVNVNGSTLQIQLCTWKLANHQSVHCYVPVDSTTAVQLLRPKPYKNLSLDEKVVYAQRLKLCATQLSTTTSAGKSRSTDTGKYLYTNEQWALDLYRKSIHVTTSLLSTTKQQQLWESSLSSLISPLSTTSNTNNSFFMASTSTKDMSTRKAEWLIQSVKCSNAAASCAMRLEQYDEALEWAKNALVILQALEKSKTPNDDASSQVTNTSGTHKLLEWSLGQEEEKKQDDDFLFVDDSESSDSGPGSWQSLSEQSPKQLEPLGAVKLFGDCRCHALLVTAEALLRKDPQHRHASRRILEKAHKQCILKYTQSPTTYSDDSQTTDSSSNRQCDSYLTNPLYRPCMKKLAVHQKNLRRIKKEIRKIGTRELQKTSSAAIRWANQKQQLTLDQDRTPCASNKGRGNQNDQSWLNRKRVSFQGEDEASNRTTFEDDDIPSRTGSTRPVLYGAIAVGVMAVVATVVMSRNRRR